jgi:hypothetical protein
MFLADCHGIQSLVPFDNSLTNILTQICIANFQRFSLWGLIDLDDELFQSCKEIIEDKEGKKTLLKAIKERQYSLPTSHSMFKNFIKKIPNDELDPFY